MCDAFLTLAHCDMERDSLSCFFVPRFQPDGTRNPFLIQRLKDKLGNRSNASAEIEYNGTWCRLVGERGRGVQTIIEMVNHTRLDCVIGSAALMRLATLHALHHARHRRAFGLTLEQHPLMLNVLADLAIETTAATHTFAWLAAQIDTSHRGNRDARRLSRFATAIGKYWVCKRTPQLVYEALECLGGNGYVEETVLPRAFRESPLNSIWEGSGSVIALDIIRAIGSDPELPHLLLTAIRRLADGASPALTKHIADVDVELRRVASGSHLPADVQRQARWLADRLAVALQAALLHSHAAGQPLLATAYVDSRIATGGHAANYGSLRLPESQMRSIVDFAYGHD